MQVHKFWRAGQLITIATLFLIAIPQAQAEDIGVRDGLFQLGGSASASVVFPSVAHTNSQTTIWGASADLGFFVSDPLSIDLLPASSGNFSGDFTASLHVGATYHFIPRSVFTPYIQGGLGVSHIDVPGLHDTNGSFLLGAGVKYFLTHDVALDAGVKYLALFDHADEGSLPLFIGIDVFFE